MKGKGKKLVSLTLSTDYKDLIDKVLVNPTIKKKNFFCTLVIITKI